jgi:hypothetical protein
LADLPLNGFALPLVFKKLPPLLSQQLWITNGATEARTTQTNAMSLAEGSAGSRSINLISTDHLWIVAISAAISSCLNLQIFSFILEVITQPIEKDEHIASD